MPTAAHKTITGREYLRVSKDRSGRARSVGEQHKDNVPVAAERGVALGVPYIDNAKSASRYSTEVRGDFDKLLVDLLDGSFGADELWLWESSRGSRRVGEWVDLIEACVKAHVKIYVKTHGRAYDPANARDRRSLLEDAVDSEYESSKVSDRSLRAAASNAVAGQPYGAVPYGYLRRYDERTRRLISQEPHPDEAPIVREIFDRLAKGHSLRAIAADLTARGVVNRRKRPFPPNAVRDLALNPSYAALRVHDPAGRKGTGRERRFGSTGAETVEGTWEPLVDRETFYAVRARLADPARTTTRPGKAKHLLSLIATCGMCGGTLQASQREGVDNYVCRVKGCVKINQADLDALATKAMLGYLARPDVYEPGGDDAPELERVRAEIATVEGELRDLRAAVGARKLTVASLVGAEPGLIAQIATLRERERELKTPSMLRGLIPPDVDVEQWWKDEETQMSAKRDVARELLVPGHLGTLAVLRRPVGGSRRSPAEERVDWVKTASPTASSAS